MVVDDDDDDDDEDEDEDVHVRSCKMGVKICSGNIISSVKSVFSEGSLKQ